MMSVERIRVDLDDSSLNNNMKPIQSAKTDLRQYRGPDLSAVVERLRSYRPGDATTVFLGGNHEEVMLRVLAGEQGGLLANWLRFGGAECLVSYSLDPAELTLKNEADALKAIKAAVPQAHADFLAGFAATFRFGDYLFVHAGIRPGLGIAEQSQTDLRWIREPFLRYDMRPCRLRKAPVCFSPALYKQRNLIERFFNKLKYYRRIATRYD